MAEDVVRRGGVTPAGPGLDRGGFHAEVGGSGGSVVVRAEGELDLASAPVLEAALTTAMNAEPSAVAVDLSELTFLDSTGIRVLLSAGRRAGRDGCSLTLHSPRPVVLKVLQLTGIERVIAIEQDPPGG